ncbi:dienelactone hydrolase family protein [Aestuariivirga litoralis]|uniref:dienelactone hydrolase family protein n=1 Tax=Aestuariivirga litoralis TaxID=2650924 RepID=UPI0018C4809D|nr:dienelactone hydrolase family protein [Aestuariivirga litoralis]MBG1230847.1 dienelactone hydrolase family protein [Aestuariivirga litoralis]
MGTRISFPRIDGKKAEGYLSKAAHDHAPGVVVIQEWWGLQDNIKGTCDRLALAGYDALAPDLYAGRVVPYHDHDAAEAEMKSLNFADAAQNVVRGAMVYLKQSSPKVGIIGFCMGGAVAMLSSTAPEISCVAPFYGLPPEQFLDISKIKVPVQGHFSNTDDFVTPERAKAFDAALTKVGVKHEIYGYDASHAFMNEQRDVHDRAQAEIAWGRLLKFLGENLG